MRLEDVPTVLLVASGKGGVGKTTVSSDLAHSLDQRGYNVGVIDADISTPNTPAVLTGGDDDFSDQRMSDGDSLLPVDVDGIQLMSQGLSLPDDVVLLRSGEFRAESVAEYIEYVEWDDDTDVVIVDSPPGSGEEVQVILNAAMPDHTFIVTTSHSSSLQDAHRTSLLMEQANVPSSVVVNMTHIPPAELVEHMWDSDTVQDVDGVGEKTEQKIRENLEHGTSEFPLFQNGDDIETAVGNPIEIRVPYTENENTRREVFDKIVPEQYHEEMEVEL